jgi:AcrR family transcriptional regulator
MRNTKADRRSKRTRQLLNQALLGLMLEKRYDEITVQDIIDRANVGRSTFYAHYLDKEDLLVSEFTRVLDALVQHIDRGEREGQLAPPNLAPFFGHVQEHYPLYKALVRGGMMNLLYKKGHERLRQNIKQHLGAFIRPEHTPAVPLTLLADYTAGAVLMILTWWLDNEMPYTPEQMDAMFRQLVLPGVLATLHPPNPESGMLAAV